MRDDDGCLDGNIGLELTGSAYRPLLCLSERPRRLGYSQTFWPDLSANSVLQQATRLSNPHLLVFKVSSYRSPAQWLTLQSSGNIDRLNLISTKACFIHKPRGTGTPTTESLCVQYLRCI
jgi:hypothetical protein